MPPDDFEGQVDDHLTLLRSDVDRVAWADGATIRRRGVRRQAQRAATTGLILVAGMGVVGYSAIVGVPGTTIVLGNPFLAASPSDRTATPLPPSRQRPPQGKKHSEAEHHQLPFLPGSAAPSSSLDMPAPSGLPSPSGPGVLPTPTPSPSTGSPEPTSTPDTPSQNPTPTPLAADALLAAEEMPQVNDSGLSWVSTGTQSDEGSAISQCVSGDLASLGATSAIRGDYTWGPDGPITGTNIASVFPSAAEAASAYDTYANWLSGCSWGTAHGPTDAGVGDQSGWWWVGHDNGDGTGQIEAVGLVRTGAAVSVVVWRQSGQNLDYTNDPMQPALQSANDRLAAYAGG